MQRTTWSLTLAAVTVAALLGVGAFAYFTSEGVAAQSDGLPPGVAWMPDSASFVGHVDLTALMESPFRAQWEDELEKHENYEGLLEFQEMTGIDPFRDLYGATFSAMSTKRDGNDDTRSERPDRWGVAILGNFDPTRLLARISQDGNVGEAVYQGTTIYEIAKNGRTQAFAFTDDDTILLGAPDYLRQMLDAGYRRRGSARAGLLQNWGENAFAGETFWVTGAPEKALGGMLPRGGQMPPIQSFALSGRLDVDFALQARGRAADSEAATKLADIVRGFVALGSLQQQENPDLSELLSSVQIDQMENEVTVSMAVPYETLKRLSERTQAQAQQN